MTDKQQYDVLFKRLSGFEFEPLRDFLRQQTTDKLGELSLAKEPIDIYRLQGEVRALKMLLRLVTEKRG